MAGVRLIFLAKGDTPMINRTRWNGTEAELLVLVDVLGRHCACKGVRGGGLCSPHSMLTEQRSVDGLLFGRRIVQRLLREEFESTAPANC
jgi:hypothetical protein